MLLRKTCFSLHYFKAKLRSRTFFPACHLSVTFQWSISDTRSKSQPLDWNLTQLNIYFGFMFSICLSDTQLSLWLAWMLINEPFLALDNHLQFLSSQLEWCKQDRKSIFICFTWHWKDIEQLCLLSRIIVFPPFIVLRVQTSWFLWLFSRFGLTSSCVYTGVAQKASSCNIRSIAIFYYTFSKLSYIPKDWWSLTLKLVSFLVLHTKNQLKGLFI